MKIGKKTKSKLLVRRKS